MLADIKTDDVPVSGGFRVIDMLSIALEFSLFLLFNINWKRENWFVVAMGTVMTVVFKFLVDENIVVVVVVLTMVVEVLIGIALVNVVVVAGKVLLVVGIVVFVVGILVVVVDILMGVLGIVVFVIVILVSVVLIVVISGTVTLVGKSWLKNETVVWLYLFSDGVDFATTGGTVAMNWNEVVVFNIFSTVVVLCWMTVASLAVVFVC